jgi:hypothetical protein
LSFCLDDLSIDDNGVLKSPTTTVLAFIYAFRSFQGMFDEIGCVDIGCVQIDDYYFLQVLLFFSVC